MEVLQGTVVRVSFDQSSKLRPLVMLLRVGKEVRLLEPILTSTDIENHEATLRLTKAGDDVKIELTSAKYLKSFHNADLERAYTSHG